MKASFVRSNDLERTVRSQSVRSLNTLATWILGRCGYEVDYNRLVFDAGGDLDVGEVD